MPDDQLLPPTEIVRFDAVIGVPEPAPLDMPRRQIRRFALDIGRLLPGPAAVMRQPQDTHAG